MGGSDFGSIAIGCRKKSHQERLPRFYLELLFYEIMPLNSLTILSKQQSLKQEGLIEKARFSHKQGILVKTVFFFQSKA